MIPYSRLTDGQVTLRPFQFTDVSDLYEAIRESLSELKPWMSWAHDGYTVKDSGDFVTLVRAKWGDGTVYGFAITDTQDGSLLGGCSISHIYGVYRFCNLGYRVRTNERGRGIAGRAAKLAARWGIERLGLIRIEIMVATGNAASIRVAEKLGAQQEGILRNRITAGNRTHDALMFSLIPNDFVLGDNARAK